MTKINPFNLRLRFQTDRFARDSVNYFGSSSSSHRCLSVTYLGHVKKWLIYSTSKQVKHSMSVSHPSCCSVLLRLVRRAVTRFSFFHSFHLQFIPIGMVWLGSVTSPLSFDVSFHVLGRKACLEVCSGLARFKEVFLNLRRSTSRDCSNRWRRLSLSCCCLFVPATASRHTFGGAITASLYKWQIRVPFKHPVILRIVSLGAISTCFACDD